MVLALKKPYRTIVTIAVLTGLRKGELEVLLWRDIREHEINGKKTVYRGRLGTAEDSQIQTPCPHGYVCKYGLTTLEGEDALSRPGRLRLQYPDKLTD